MVYIFIFFLGAVIGSFLNVVIDRLPKGQSILYPPSHCPHCRHRLAFYDLIPLLSFFYLGGKCRYCREKISLYYPLIEATTGTLFVLAAYAIKIPPNLLLLGEEQLFGFGYFIYLLLVISVLIIVFFIDLKYGIIPFKIVVFLLAVATIWYLFVNIGCIFPGLAGAKISPNFPLLREQQAATGCSLFIFHYFLSGIGVFGVFLLLFLATKGRGIGFGDVVFSFLMGYILGFPKVVLGVYIAFLTGAIVSLILVAARKKKFRGGVIPFGPFLVAGTVISLFWGQIIIDRLFLYFHVF